MVDTISLTDVHKIQRHDLGEGDDLKDMINHLPEGILLHILSLLPTKDAVRTSVLAKNWRHLWKHLSVFHFESVLLRHESPHQNQKTANCLLDLVGRLLNRSNRIERLHVKIFRITFDADKVSYLISSAMTHEKIQYLRLSLGDRNYQFMLPYSSSAFASLNELWLGIKFTLHIPSGICFPSLKKLVVSNVTFANHESVQQLFSACPVLEELDLYHCHWKYIEEIYVEISTLRKLRIRFNILCVEYDHDMTLMIDAVNLVSLDCISIPTIQFIPDNLTSLVDAHIDLWYVFQNSELYAAHCAFELLRGLNNVKSLTISTITLQCLYHTKDTLHLLPLFHKLTHLYVKTLTPKNTDEVLFDILRKTPKLEVLTIPGVVVNDLNGEDLMLNSVPCCFKYSLNQLCVLQFNGDEYEIQFIMLILNNSPHLREINIRCSRHFTADKEKMTDVLNQLEYAGAAERCVIKFLDKNDYDNNGYDYDYGYDYYDDNDENEDEQDEDA